MFLNISFNVIMIIGGIRIMKKFMEKYNLLKILLITFLMAVILTWLIPTSFLVEGQIQMEGTSPLGLLDLIETPLNTFLNFINIGALFIIIGGLYGVINKTGTYTIIIENIVNYFKDKKEQLLISISILLIVLSSITGNSMLLFVFIPFLTAIIMSLGYDKMTSFLATIGSILVGNLGATYGTNINTVLKYYLNISIHNEIITKVIFLIIISVVFILYLVNTSKTSLEKNSKKANDIPLYVKTKNNKRNPLPLIIIVGIVTLFLFVAMFDWINAFDVKIFRDMHEAVMGIKSNGYPIISHLLGYIKPIGNWQLNDLTIMLIILSVVLSWVYSLTFDETLESFIDGAKEMVPLAIYVTLANILIMTIYYNHSGSNIFNTLSNFLLTLTKGFNVITMSLTSLIGSIFFNDFVLFTSAISSITNVVFNNSLLYPKIAIIAQFVHGLVMFVSPTSLLLIAGLVYFDVSYSEWVKKIWDFLLKVLLISFVVIIIVMIFI